MALLRRTRIFPWQVHTDPHDSINKGVDSYPYIWDHMGTETPCEVAKAIDGGETVFSIDSKPVKVCQNARANRCQMGKDDIEHAPSWGYCASQNIYNLFSSSSRMGYLFSSM